MPSLIFHFIYIPIWLYLLLTQERTEQRDVVNLHSNMVIFIIWNTFALYLAIPLFTFQYGYIYYASLIDLSISLVIIYIPIWLYLLFMSENKIVIEGIIFTFQYGYIYYNMDFKNIVLIIIIYIPIWLYLLSEKNELDSLFSAHLHSNMVIFIIQFRI